MSGWSIEHLWRSMGSLGRADVALLALMLVNTAVIMCGRFQRYHAARRQSRSFVCDAAAALRDGRLDEVLAVAARNIRSHVAATVAAALGAFHAAPPHFTHAEAIAAAERACRRSRKIVGADLRLGLRTLATIASSAPFIGLLGTVFGILNAFRGVGMERHAVIAMIASSLAEALVTTAMGLLVAVPAVWCGTYLRGRMEVFESEMSNAALEAVTYLNSHCKWRDRPECRVGSASARDPTPALIPDLHLQEAPYDRQRAVLTAMWACALFVVFVLARGWYLSYVWQRSYEEESTKWETVEGQELISPDRRYRALVPLIYREKVYSSDKDKWHWSCGSPTVVRMVPNDRLRAWKPRHCGVTTTYALEPDEVLLTWNCEVPVIMWRTNDELLIQCSNCATANVQLMRPDFFLGRITVLGPDGKRIHPQVVHPQPQCFD